MQQIWVTIRVVIEQYTLLSYEKIFKRFLKRVIEDYCRDISLVPSRPVENIK